MMTYYMITPITETETKKMHRATKHYWKNKNRLGIKRVNIDLPSELWEKACKEAEVQGVKKREIVIQALEEYLS